MRRLLLIVPLLALAAVPPGTHAEKADRDKPTQIEADAWKYDDLKQVSTYTGNVVVAKGTLLLRGDQMELREDPQGFRTAVVTVAPPRQVFYRQKRDTERGQPEEYIEATADRVEYDERTDTVRLIGNARVATLRGGVTANESAGDLIVLDNLKGTFDASGRSRPTGDNPGGRVRQVLAPPARAGASAPAADGAKLKPSGTLGPAQ
jgi:lipopolysaccharide export system protein LptA